MKTYYEELGVSETATIEEIKKAYLELVKKYHPDVYEGEKQFAIEQTQKLNNIFNVLKDENQRKIYDESIQAPQSQEQMSQPQKKKFSADLDGGIFSGLKKRFTSAFENNEEQVESAKNKLSQKQKMGFIIWGIICGIILLLLILLFI